jgi:hypothetical protein
LLIENRLNRQLVIVGIDDRFFLPTERLMTVFHFLASVLWTIGLPDWFPVKRVRLFGVLAW